MTVKTSPSDNGDGHQHTEDDTARALRKIPYEELKAIIREGDWFEELTSEEKTEVLDKYGWTFDELLKALLSELGDQLKMFV